MEVRLVSLYNDVEENYAITLSVDLDRSAFGKIVFAERNPEVQRQGGGYQRGTKVYLWDRARSFTIGPDEATQMSNVVKEFLQTGAIKNTVEIKHSPGSGRFSKLILALNERNQLVLKYQLEENGQIITDYTFAFNKISDVQILYKYLQTLSTYGLMMIAIYQSLKQLSFQPKTTNGSNTNVSTNYTPPSKQVSQPKPNNSVEDLDEFDFDNI